MSWITDTLGSSIGKKLLMSLTGLFLILFLVIHLVGNLAIFSDDGGLSFNSYAVFMSSFPLIKAVSTLFQHIVACILCHDAVVPEPESQTGPVCG